MPRWKFTVGKKTKDLLNFDFLKLRKMPEKQVREIVSRIAATANKRLKRLEEKGIYGPAYEQAMTAGKFSTRGKDLNQLISEYLREVQFLNRPSSTPKGAVKEYIDTASEAYEASGREFDREEFEASLGDEYEEIEHWGQYVHMAEDLGIEQAVKYEVYIEAIKRIVAEETEAGSSHQWMQKRILAWVNHMKTHRRGTYNAKFDASTAIHI